MYILGGAGGRSYSEHYPFQVGVFPGVSVADHCTDVGGIVDANLLSADLCGVLCYTDAMSAAERENAVLDWIDRHHDKVLSILQKLVRIPSVYPEEGEAQGFVSGILNPLCDAVDVWEPDASALAKHPGYFAMSPSFSGRPNVVGIIKGTGGGRSLLLNAHIDVVPPQPESEWPFGAWSGAIHDGWIYGRGSLDDKSGIAMMLSLAQALRETGVKLRGDLQLHSVVDEEWGGAGTLACMQRGYRADAGVILEPVGPDIYRASRGGQTFRVTVRGRGAHPGASWKGVSALEKAIPVIQALKHLEAERNRDLRAPPFSEYQIFVPIVVGKIQADNIPSKVPEECAFEGLYGYLPQEHWSEARRTFEGCIATVAAQDEWLSKHPPVVTWLGLNKEGAEISADHPFVQCLTDSVSTISRRVPRVTGFPAGTDLPLLVRYGSVPSVLYGVECAWEDAHSSTERVEVEKLLIATRCIACAAMRWCGIAD
jgi:acetylornithine deacetylase